MRRTVSWALTLAPFPNAATADSTVASDGRPGAVPRRSVEKRSPKASPQLRPRKECTGHALSGAFCSDFGILELES